MSNTVSKPGRYVNYTGEVEDEWSIYTVKNATFEILDKVKKFKNEIHIRTIFEKGDITGGNLSCIMIEHCNFYGDKLESSVFCDGIFDGGKFENSFWLGGEWIDGDWVGSTNRDKFGQHHILPPPFDKVDKAGDIITEPGRYRNYTGKVTYNNTSFYIKNGDFDIGKEVGQLDSLLIVIHDGVITKGDLYCPVINYVEFYGREVYNADWKNGIFNGEKFTGYKAQWHDGTFKGGAWKDGEWKNGIWESGNWESGTWRGGYDGDDNHHDYGDSPDKWTM